jgi:hypothetical protein
VVGTARSPQEAPAVGSVKWWGNYTDLDYWQPFFNHWDFVHLPEADYQIDSIRYVTFAHDWRRVGVAEWLERTAARELGALVGGHR